MKTITMILMMLALATQQLNKPYVYSATGPNSFDCSGLVVFCYEKEFNIELPRTAEEIGYCPQYETIGNIHDLQKGDIVCFNTNKWDDDLSDHVGIYLGDYEFIHASSEKGKVIISPLNEGFYYERFSWGKRILDYN